ncbi:MAG: tetratricopeptide repeat protein [Muribaculaceae bacterium]|nr:tetratricopeptide repeat protein [Muribaculaceae bacterium]
MKKLYRYIPVILILATVIISACSTKKNTAGSRFWHAMNTRYNVYYNGEKHYQEQIKKLENEYQDDYSTQLFIHPAEAYNNPKATQPTTNFDRTIEKMQKAISLHSIKKKPNRKAGKGSDPKYKEWLKREEYNPFIHNAWYLMAKAQYMKGDFLSSAATFHYIARHFQWKPDLVLEAQIWEALSYCAMDWTTEADNILVHIHPERIEDNRLSQLANLAYADFYIKSQMNAEAVPYMEKAVKGASGGQKVRLYFLLGQLYDETGQKEKAYQAYKKAGSSSSSSYRTKFNARIKQSAVFQGSNIESEVKALKRMTRYDRNKEYLDQIYYAIGNLYLSRGDTVHAVENYELAAKKSTRNGIDKAISQLTLGGIYFAQHKYDKAQPCYSEAIPQLSENYPNYKELKQRSDVLDELAVYSGNVTLQDSLLRLSQMPLDEQKKVIAKIIEDLKKKEKEEKENADREAYLAQQQGNSGLKGNAQQPATYNINSDNSWYFYNTMTKNSGKTAFQQQWGNRKLEDNWRRRNKNTFSLDENNEEEEENLAMNDSTQVQGNDSTQVDKEALKRAEDPHYEEYYLKQIPKTEEEIQNSNDVIQEGLYNMGVILKDKLADLPAAIYEFEELMERYPDNTYRLDTYYNMYLLYYRSGEFTDAERYRQKILDEFADSKYGQAMQDPNYLENLKRMNLVQEELYDQAYTAYLNNDNATVHAAYVEMMKTYPLSKIMPKFMFIDALAYVTEGNSEKFKSTIKEMLERYPETDITPTASAFVKQLNQGRKINGGSSNTRGMLWSMRLSNDTTATGEGKEFTPFKEGKNKPQLFVLVFSTDSVSPNQLLYEVAKHNFNSFLMRDFDLEQMTFGNLGLIVVKGFPNYREVEIYRDKWEKDEEKVVPAQAHYVIISDENFNLLLKEGRTFEEYFRYLDELNEEKVEEQIPDDAVDDEKKDDGAEDDSGGEETDEDKPTKSVKKGQGKADEKKDEKDVKKKDEKKEKADEKKEEKPKVDTPEQQGNPALLEEARRRAEQRQLEEQRKEEEKRKAEEAKKREEELKRQQEREREAERLRAEDEAKKQQEAEKQGKNDKDTTDKDNKDNKRNEKEAKKAEKERQKQLEREEKERQKQLEREQKEREKEQRAAEKAKEDSIKAAEKEREELQKQKEREKEDAKKLAEKERKDKQKAKEEARKQKEKERKERQKEREKKKKEEQKRKKEEQKRKKEEAKKRQKEREEQRKQRERERKEAGKNK